MVASIEAVEEYMEELLFPVSTEKPKQRHFYRQHYCSSPRFFGRNQMKSFNAKSNANSRSRRNKNEPDSHLKNNQRLMLRLGGEREAVPMKVEREDIRRLRTNDKKQRRQTDAGKKDGKALKCSMNERETDAVYSDCGSTITSSHEYEFFTDGEESYHSDSRTYPQVIEEWLLDLISGIPDN